MYLILISTAAILALVVTGGVAYINRFHSLKRGTVKDLSRSGLALFLLLWMLMTFAIGLAFDAPGDENRLAVLATLVALTVACVLPWAYKIVKLALQLLPRVQLARGVNLEAVDAASETN